MLRAADEHPGTTCERVPERVRQRFLHDAVRRKLDARGNPVALTLEHKLDCETGGAHLLDEHLEAGEPRLRRDRGTIPARPRDAEQAPQLRERLPAGGLDRRERSRARAGSASNTSRPPAACSTMTLTL